MNVAVRTLIRSPRRMQIRTNLFFSVGLTRDGRRCTLPALANALLSARQIRANTGRPVWIEDVERPAYVRPRAERRPA